MALSHDQFREDFAYWIANDKSTALKLCDLMDECLKTPTQGTGKPEFLRHLN